LLILLISNKIKVLTTRGWIQTVTSGDTGIGATLENCLGIRINSNRKPDYKGIEIKAKRIKNIKITTRSSLFAQVPDWNISRLKSSAKILESYGYFRGSIKKLYCTVKSLTPNSQGLMLKVDEANDLLHEVHQSGDIFEDVVTWRFNILRDRLLEKHNETFWVGAETKKKENIEYLECISEYYNYSLEKASQVLKILTKEQISYIKQQLDKGGRR
jgi:hypothetical protein